MPSYRILKQKKFLKILAVITLFGFICLICYPDIYVSSSQYPVSYNSHRLAVVVPFRDRFDELLEFVPHMHKFLKKQKINFEIIVVNQADSLRFNRGALINIGFSIGSNLGCDYIAMHDVDLLPLNQNLHYNYPESYVSHIASPELHPMYHYSKFVGGILIINNEDFQQVNGMTNKFWGWGREDDEFYLRIQEKNITILRPVNITTGNTTFKHVHNKYRRKRDNVRYGNQKINTRRDHITGLRSISYHESAQYTMAVDGVGAHVHNVHLHCDVKNTPWCMTPLQMGEYLKELNRTVSQSEFEDILVAVKMHNMIS